MDKPSRWCWKYSRRKAWHYRDLLVVRYYRRLVLYYRQEARRWREIAHALASRHVTSGGPNGETQIAIAECDAGLCETFDDAETFFADLDADYAAALRKHGGK